MRKNYASQKQTIIQNSYQIDFGSKFEKDKDTRTFILTIKKPKDK